MWSQSVQSWAQLMSANLKQITSLFNTMTNVVVTCRTCTDLSLFSWKKSHCAHMSRVWPEQGLSYLWDRYILEIFVTSDSSRKLCTTLTVFDTVVFVRRVQPSCFFCERNSPGWSCHNFRSFLSEFFAEIRSFRHKVASQAVFFSLLWNQSCR